MDKFNSGLITLGDTKDMENFQVIAAALVIMNNNLYLLTEEIRDFNRLCKTGINVNTRME